MGDGREDGYAEANFCDKEAEDDEGCGYCGSADEDAG